MAAALSVAIAVPVAADPLDEALHLVMTRHPEMAAREAEFRAIRESPRWSADLNLSLTEGRTEFGATGGPRAVMSVTIPLGGSGHDEKRSRSRRELESARDALRAAFLGDVTGLRALAQQVEHRRERRDFWRDQVEYYQEAVEADLHEPDRLWNDADRLQQAEHAFRVARLELEVELDRAARRYGGREWQRLRRLLVEIAN